MARAPARVAVCSPGEDFIFLGTGIDSAGAAAGCYCQQRALLMVLCTSRLRSCDTAISAPDLPGDSFVLTSTWHKPAVGSYVAWKSCLMHDLLCEGRPVNWVDQVTPPKTKPWLGVLSNSSVA